MAFTSITQAEIAAGQPVTQALMQKVKDNDDYLYSQIGAGGGSGEGGIPNGSFEIDADSDGVPDGWTKNLYPAGGGSLETTSPMHGAAAYKFVQQAGPGNGGGYLDQNDYLPCSPDSQLIFAWLHYATAAGMHNIVQVRWFDKGKVYLSTTSIYDSTSNPTSKARIFGFAVPPATAQFYKLRIIGGYTDTDIAGTAYFDGFRVAADTPVSWINPGSISQVEGTGTYPTWTSGAGSVSVPLPILSSNSLVRLTIIVNLKASSGDRAYARFRLGSYQSDEVSVLNTAYEAVTVTLLAKGLSGNQTLYMDLAITSIYTCLGKVDAGDISVEILNP